MGVDEEDDDEPRNTSSSHSSTPNQDDDVGPLPTAKPDDDATIVAASPLHSKQQPPKDTPPTCRPLRAMVRSLFRVDHTLIAVVPGLRTACILMIEWAVLGVANPTTTPFQLAALFVGFTDPNESLSRRLRVMGLTGLSVVTIGTALPALVWSHDAAFLSCAFCVALITGLSPLLQSPALFQALKLGTVLFAVNGGVSKSTRGFEAQGGVGYFVLYAVLGATASLVAALIPEMIGTRDAVRTNLFQMWNGYGHTLVQWNGRWGTHKHYFEGGAGPTVTMVIAKTEATIETKTLEDEQAQQWLLEIVRAADSMRAASLCLSNVYPRTHAPSGDNEDNNSPLDRFFETLGLACCQLALALQFPWLVRYGPCFQKRYQRIIGDVTQASLQLKEHSQPKATITSNHNQPNAWLPPIVDLIHTQLQTVANQVQTWPSLQSPKTLPQRIQAAFGKSGQGSSSDLQLDPRLVYSYALRFAIAFTLAAIPEALLGEGYRAHWFPMTVALILTPTEAATHVKVLHRTLGTLCGIALGTLLYPLMTYEPWIILLLGINTYAVVVFFQANYAIFTFFITSWVLTTSVGEGAEFGVTSLYRCLWTLAAGLLVLVVLCIDPTTSSSRNYVLGDQLAAMAKAVQRFARMAVEEHRQVCCHDDNDPGKDGETEPDEERNTDQKNRIDLHRRVEEARQEVIQARVALLKCINQAVLSSTEGRLVDPHSLGPALASDLIDAVVIPQTILLIPNDKADELVTDMDDDTYAEMDRLAQRLQAHGNLSKKCAQTQEEYQSQVLENARGPFSNAIAQAHWRLDQAGVPS